MSDINNKWNFQYDPNSRTTQWIPKSTQVAPAAAATTEVPTTAVAFKPNLPGGNYLANTLNKLDTYKQNYGRS